MYNLELCKDSTLAEQLEAIIKHDIPLNVFPIVVKIKAARVDAGMLIRKIVLVQIISIVYCSGASVLSVRGQQRVCNTRQRGHSQVQYTEFRRRIRSGHWLARRSGELFRSGSGQRYNPKLLGNTGSRNPRGQRMIKSTSLIPCLKGRDIYLFV